MAGVFEIGFEFDEAEAQAWFDYAGYKTRHPREPLQRAGTELLHHINLTFESEGDWIGHPWPELSDGYRAYKEAHYGDRPLLVASGKMRTKAISRRSIKVLPGFDGGMLIYALSVGYASFHQEGTENEDGTTRMPARPFLELTHEYIESVEDIFRDWLEDLRSRNRTRRNLDLPNPFDA